MSTKDSSSDTQLSKKIYLMQISREKNIFESYANVTMTKWLTPVVFLIKWS